MYTRETTSEYTYTLAEAKQIIRKEELRKRAKFFNRIKQIALGILCISVAIASPLLLDGDATISVLMLPLGIYAIVTKENILN